MLANFAIFTFAIWTASCACGQIAAGIEGPWFQRQPSGLMRTNGPPMPGGVAPPAMTCAADGVVVNAIGGEPVVRAHVAANGMGAGAFATSDTQGRWQITGMPCGAVRFSAQKAGFLSAAMGLNRAQVFFKPVVVSDGSPVHDVKIELTPQGVILGKVIDENGDPLQNVQVMVIASGVQEGKRQWQPRGGAQTNDLGEYRLHSLNPGKVILCARANMMPMSPGAQRTMFPESCYPGPAEGSSPSTLEITPGREMRVDFTLNPMPGVSVKGTVSGAPSNRGIGLQLRKRDSTFNAPQSTNTTFLADGSFVLAGVSPGSYLLTANVWEPQNRLYGEIPVEVGSSDVQGVQLTLAPGFSVTGTVRIEGTVDKKAGPAMPANVFLRPVEGQITGMGQMKWSEDKQSFTIPDVMPGRYHFDVNAMASQYVKSVRLGNQDLLAGAITLQQAAGPIEIVLSDDAGIVQGTLKDTAGNGVSGQVVLLNENGRRPIFAFAPPEGQFTVHNVPPGTYKLYSWSDPQQAEFANPDWMRQHGADGIDVSVNSKQTVKVDAKQTVLP